MICLAHIERVADVTKRLLSERRKAAKLSDRLRDFRGTPKQTQKLSVDLHWQAMHVVDLEHELHVALVDAGLADMRPADHYAERTHKPSAWHEYKRPAHAPEAINAEA